MVRQVSAVDDMTVTMDMLAGLRTEADELHDKAMKTAEKRDEAARALIRRLASQIRELRERCSILEDTLIAQAKDVEEDEDVTFDEGNDEDENDEEEDEDDDSEENDEEDVEEDEKEDVDESRKTLEPSSAKQSVPKTPGASTRAVSAPGSVKKSPALSHVPLSSAVAPERTSIALPPQSPRASKDHSGAARIALLERVVKFYEDLTGITVQPSDAAGDESSFACTAVNAPEHRAIEFQMLFGDNTVDYTPVKIDVPKDFSLSEMVTEAIEFEKTQTPIFLSKLLDELHSELVSE